jgi:hypothetical protein
MIEDDAEFVVRSVIVARGDNPNVLKHEKKTAVADHPVSKFSPKKTQKQQSMSQANKQTQNRNTKSPLSKIVTMFAAIITIVIFFSNRDHFEDFFRQDSSTADSKQFEQSFDNEPNNKIIADGSLVHYNTGSKGLMLGTKGITAFAGSATGGGPLEGLDSGYKDGDTFDYSYNDIILTYEFVGKIPINPQNGLLQNDIPQEIRAGYHVINPNGIKISLDEMNFNVTVFDNTITPWTIDETEDDSYLILYVVPGTGAYPDYAVTGVGYVARLVLTSQ